MKNQVFISLILITFSSYSLSKELNLTCTVDEDVTFEIYLNINNSYAPDDYAGHVTLISDELFYPFKAYQEQDLGMWGGDRAIRAVPLVYIKFKDTYEIKSPLGLPLEGMGGAFKISINRKTLMGQGSYNSGKRKLGFRKTIDFENAPCNVIKTEEDENII